MSQSSTVGADLRVVCAPGEGRVSRLLWSANCRSGSTCPPQELICQTLSLPRPRALSSGVPASVCVCASVCFFTVRLKGTVTGWFWTRVDMFAFESL